MLDKLKTAVDEISDVDTNTTRGKLSGGPIQVYSLSCRRSERILRGRHQGDISKTTKFLRHENIACKFANYYRKGNFSYYIKMVRTAPTTSESNADSVCVIQELWLDFLKSLSSFKVTGDVVMAVGIFAIATTVVAFLMVIPLRTVRLGPSVIPMCERT